MQSIRALLKTRFFSLMLTALTLLLIVRAGGYLLVDCTILPNLWSIWFAVAVGASIVYRVINAVGWSLVLEAMGCSAISRKRATQIWLRAESRRWLPGGVWGYAFRAVQADQLGVSKSTASASMLVELILTMVASLIVILPCAILYRSEASILMTQAQLSWPLIGGAIATILTLGAVVLRSQRMRQKLVSVSQRFSALRDNEFEPMRLVKALSFFVLMAILNGFVTLSLFWAMAPTECPPALVVVAATALAWVIGFLAIFAPGGLVVREAAFAIVLGFWTPYATGFAVAVMSRVLQMGAEVVVLVVIECLGRASCSKTKSPAGTPCQNYGS